MLQLPVVIRDTNLVASALHWDLDYLEENIGDGRFTVYQSSNTKFKYFDEKKIENVRNFRKPMEATEMKFSHFVEKLKSAVPGTQR